MTRWRRKQDQSLAWCELHWPRDLDERQVLAWLNTVAADHNAKPLILEIASKDRRLSYRLAVPAERLRTTLHQLSSLVPQLHCRVIEYHEHPSPTHAWELRCNSRTRPWATTRPETLATALTAALTSSDAPCLIQLTLGTRLRPQKVPTKPMKQLTIASALTTGLQPLDSEATKALRAKTGEPGFQLSWRLGVTANEAVATQLASRLLAAVRTLEAPGVTIGLRRANPVDVATARPRSLPLCCNTTELLPLLGWPLGEGTYQGVSRAESRTLPPPTGAETETSHRVIGTAVATGTSLGLPAASALHHLHVLGPTGTGKSTLLLGLITADMTDGRGVVVLDPKGDLIEDVLARVPKTRQTDVVVLDPADADSPVGLNPLQGNGSAPELLADHVLAVFHGLYRDSWGPRTQDILHAALLTLVRQPDATICALPVLLTNPGFRRRLTAGLSDGIGLQPFWSWYESLSDAERNQAIAPVMNKLRSLLLRPNLRSVLGQQHPKFEMSDVFTKHKIVLVSLAKGQLGSEAASLFGSLVVASLWHATQARSAVPPSRRRAVMVYLDEFQDYLHLPTDLSDVLAQARGLGVGLTLAHQHFAQLNPAMRSAVLANARSQIFFQLAAEDAAAVARSTTLLEAADFAGLPRFAAYARLMSDQRQTEFCSVQTSPPSEVSSDPAAIRRLSRDAYGVPRATIESELQAMIDGDPGEPQAPIGRRRRS